jgi:dolichyl-phosphate beta-glucosyltransferase
MAPFFAVFSLHSNEMPMTVKGLPLLRRRPETGSVNLMGASDKYSDSSNTKPAVSLVIPVHNGADFVARSVIEARQFLVRACPAYEVVVVDDGSTDGTSEALEALVDDRFKLVVLPENLGKFGALKAGMAAATGRCRVFTDADLPYDLEALPYITNLVNGMRFDIVVGDRTLPESVSLSNSRVARKLSSRIFSYVVRMLVTGGLFDSQCGIKGFRAEVADALFPLVRDDSFSGDVELLYIALKHNLSIRRIPVRLQRESPSTVRLRWHSLPMLGRILRLRHNWYSGCYDSDALSRIASQSYWSKSPADAPKETT